jgi:ribosomal protein L19
MEEVRNKIQAFRPVILRKKHEELGESFIRHRRIYEVS